MSNFKDASAWAVTPDELTLSKGTVLVVKPDLLALVMTDTEGNIPDAITNRILDRFKPDDGAKKKRKPEGLQPDKADMDGMYRFIRLMVTAAMHWPRIVDKPDPDYQNGEIKYEDLARNQEDLLKVFEYAMPGELSVNSQVQNGSS